jgi:predicted enzyme related to lactoylglutathione lyase
MNGRVVHFEIPYEDGDRARAFYEAAFGWQMMTMPDMGYTLVTTGPGDDQGPSEAGFINGGMMERQGDFKGPHVVVQVDNIEDALQAISDAGGSTVAERQAVGDMGFSAYARDTEGNVVGLWETNAG